MATIIKCKMCGGDLALTENSTIATCEFCGTVQTVPSQDNEKKLALFVRANRLRAACEFDKAAGIYESIVADFPEEAESYWGLVLCKYGIEYVDDPATGKKIPTCHRSSFDSIMDDPNFEQTLENADVASRKVYREEAKHIEEIRKGIIEVSNKEEPYDIFICYKETAENGDRTLDSVLAQDLYTALTDKGYRVFFSRITLEDKLGQAYESYIFAALNSAKVMLAVGTDYEYYNAVWVKNEWSRFLKLMEKDKQKHLIPCFKGIDAYDMPKEFARLQAQDLGKVGAIQDLLRGVEKLLPRKTEPVNQTVVVAQTANPSTAPLLERAYMFLEDGDWSEATAYCERVLDLEPKSAMAYLGKMMAQLKVDKIENLVHVRNPFDDNVNYKKAIRFAEPKLKETLTGFIASIQERNENERLGNIYDRAGMLLKIAMRPNNQTHENVKKAYEAAELFNQIREYKDSAEQAIRAVNAGKQITYGIAVRIQENAVSADEYEQAAAIFDKTSEYEDSRARAELCRRESRDRLEAKPYWDACEKMERVSSPEGYQEAAEMFRKLGDFRDSVERMNTCLEKSAESRKENIYFRAIREKEKKNTTGYIGAIPLFEAISGFKDADEQCAECKKLLNEIRNAKQHETQKKIAFTSEKQAEAARQEELRRQELARQETGRKAAEERIAREKKAEAERIARERRMAGLCQHCGGELKGFFSKKCASCGKPKDY